MGCGGEEESNSTPDPEPQPTTPTVEIEAVITKTSDLVTSAEFSLSSSAQLKVTLPPSSDATQYFINICSDFEQQGDNIKINYQSCKLRTTITAQEQHFTLALSTAEQNLIAQIWPLEDGATPLSIFWDISKAGNDWQLDL